MKTGLLSNDFAVVFSKILEETGVSCYEISQYAHIDQGYLSRLRNGEKRNPSPETVVRICLGLVRSSDKISLYDVEKLFNSVGRSLLIKH